MRPGPGDTDHHRVLPGTLVGREHSVTVVDFTVDDSHFTGAAQAFAAG
jgi:hypothetical protein